jgi:hypothetical protein
MNEILVYWDKIKKRMSSVNQTSNDRIPEISEIKSLLSYNDIRIRPIILTMFSSGIRVGAWNWLMEKCNSMEKDGSLIAAKLIVYYLEPDQYSTSLFMIHSFKNI